MVLNAEGLGDRHCGLETKLASKCEPPDLAICIFILEQALSVRALQEMVSASSNDSVRDRGERRETLYSPLEYAFVIVVVVLWWWR